LLLSAVAEEEDAAGLCDDGPPPLLGDFALFVVPPPTAGWAEDKWEEKEYDVWESNDEEDDEKRYGAPGDVIG
jgi:hypothetical protein